MKTKIVLVSAILMNGLAMGVSATILHVPSEYPTIQAGIYAATHGDTVLVAGGLYTGDGNRDIDFIGRRIVVMSECGPRPAIIDCQGDSSEPHRGFYFHSGEGRDSVVRGFIIRNGWANRGGGIYCRYSDPTFVRTTIVANTADTLGGGLYCYWSSPAIDSSYITDNTGRLGGGVYCSTEAWPQLTGTVISNNTSSEGGGISCDFGGASVLGCLIVGNTALVGGGVFGYAGHPTIVRTTITNNTATWGAGGGILCCGGCDLYVKNCIVWGNSAIWWSPEIEISEWDEAYITYSDVRGGWPGQGNIDADPLFVPELPGNYYLSQIEAGQVEDSPCVDAGDPSSAVPEGTTRTDHVCDVWPVDMGYHYTECVVGVGDDQEDLPQTSPCYLVQNYPNPFGSSTTIAYSVEIPTQVTLTLYDIRGAMVQTLFSCRVSSGQHRTTWDGRDDRGHEVASGIYFCHLSVGDHVETKRMVLLR